LLGGVLAIGLSSVSTYSRAAKVLRALGVKVAVVGFDADWKTNPIVAQCTAALVKQLRERGFEVELALWDVADGKGIDDLLAAGKQPDILQGEAVDRALVEIEKAAAVKAKPAAGAKASAGSGPDWRRDVTIQPEEHLVVAEVIEALAAADR